MSVRARLGLPGSLIEIPGVSALSHTPERLTSRRVTLGGRRVTQEAAREHRTWEVQLRPGSRPADVAPLAAIAAGEWGRGPFVFVSEWAQVTNVLNPRASMLEGADPARFSYGGPLILADGEVAGRHLILVGDEDVALPDRVTVAPGASMSVGLYTTGGLYLGVRWLTADGTQIYITGTEYIEPTTAAHRVTHTGEAPAGAAWAEITLRQPTAGAIVARPSLTWTPQPVPWYPGQGVDTVTLEGLTTEVGAAWSGVGGQRAGYSFTVVEVG